MADVDSMKKKISDALLWRISKNRDRVFFLNSVPEIAIAKCIMPIKKNGKLKPCKLKVMLAVHWSNSEAGDLGEVAALHKGAGNMNFSRNSIDEIYVDAKDDASLDAQLKGKVWVPLLEANCSLDTLEKLANQIDKKVFSRTDSTLIADGTYVAKSGESFESILVEIDLANTSRSNKLKSKEHII